MIYTSKFIFFLNIKAITEIKAYLDPMEIKEILVNNVYFLIGINLNRRLTFKKFQAFPVTLAKKARMGIKDKKEIK